MSSRNARPEQPAGRGEVSRITNGSVSASASCGCTCVIQEPCADFGDGCERTGLGSSADGKGEEGIDRSFEWTGIPKYLSE
jgi:hypothetical protein